jgi:hypothetical protein
MVTDADAIVDVHAGRAGGRRTWPKSSRGAKPADHQDGRPSGERNASVDVERIAQLVRSLSKAPSRRDVGRTLVGLTLGGFAFSRADGGEAKKKKRMKKVRCVFGEVFCGSPKPRGSCCDGLEERCTSCGCRPNNWGQMCVGSKNRFSCCEDEGECCDYKCCHPGTKCCHANKKYTCIGENECCPGECEPGDTCCPGGGCCGDGAHCCPGGGCCHDGDTCCQRGDQLHCCPPGAQCMETGIPCCSNC